MATYEIQAPNGGKYRIEGPEDATHEQLVYVVLQQHPEAAQVAPQTTGYGSAFKKGLESLVSSGVAGTQALFGDAGAAGREANVREEDIGRRYADQVGLDKVSAAYQKDGLFAGAKEVARQVPLALAEQAPNLAAMAGTAKLGAMAGAPLGPVGSVVGGALGAFVPSALSQLGSNVSRQTRENPEEPVDMSRAGAAAALQGGVDVVSTAIPLGKSLVGKLLGPQVEAMLARGATKEAEKLAAEKLPMLLAKGTATGAAAEIPGEVTQSLLERWQAGKPLFDDDALKEYKDTAYQTALLAPIGAAGRYADRSAAQGAIATEAQKTKQAEQQAAREADAVKAAEAEAAKNTPEYAKQVVDNYLALEAQFQALNKQRKPTNKASPTFLADVETNKQLARQAAEVKKQAQALYPEYSSLKDKVPATEPEAAPAAEAKPQDLFGEAPVQPESPAVPEVPMEVRRDELAQQIRLLPDLLEQHRDAAAKAATPEEALQHVAKFNEVQQAIAKATDEHAQLPQLPAPNTLQKQLESQQAKLAKAQELGDTEAISRAANRIIELRDLGATQGIISSKTTKVPWGSETTESFNQRVVGPEMAAGREAAATQRQKIADEQAALLRIAEKPVDNVYPEVRQEKKVGNEIAQMEKARINPLKTEQLTIPGTALPLASKVVRGAGTPATKTEAEFKADYAAAKETRNRPAMLAAIEGIRDARDRATNETPEGAATRDLAAVEPANPVRARGQALVQLLQAKPEDVEAGRGRLLERLAADIEDATGKPMPQSQRYALAAEANPVLDTLLKSSKQMLDAKKAQLALDNIRNRLAKRERGVTVETSFARETPEEVQAAPEPDTKTIDMFPEEKKAAEQHAATEAEYNKLFAPKVEESQADREARDAQTRIKEQKTAENLAELPGVRVSHEAYRVALEELEGAPVRANELVRKAYDKELPKTTQDKAKRQLKALNQRVILASGMLAHDGAKMAAAKTKVEEQLAKVREKIDSKRAAAEEEGIKKSTQQSRRRELSKLVQEERNLNKLNRSLENRAKITPIKTREDKRVAAEDRAAEKFLEQQLALHDEGTTGKLPARKIGPLVKKAVQAGNVRTGTLETTEERQLPARNKMEQAGAKRQVTSKQAVRAAEKDAEVLARKAAQEELAAANKKPAAKTRAERAIEESDFADESAWDEGGYRDFNPEADWGAASAARTDENTTLLPDDAAHHVQEGSIGRVLDSIAKDGSTPAIRALAALLKPFVGDTKIKITDGLTHKGKRVAGLYTHSNNTIQMNPKWLTEEDTLHEIVHAATMQVLSRPINTLKGAQLAAVRKLQAMHNSITQNPTFKGEYGKTDLKEFISEVMSNKLFRDKLDAVGKPTSLLQRIWIAVKEALGFTNDPQSKKASDAIEKILSESGTGSTAAAPSVFRSKPLDYGSEAGSPLADMADKYIARPVPFLERFKNNLALKLEQGIGDMRAAHAAAMKLSKNATLDSERLNQQALGDVYMSDHLMSQVQTAFTDGVPKRVKDEKGLYYYKSDGKDALHEVFSAVSELGGNDEGNTALATTYMMAQRVANVGIEKAGWGEMKLDAAELKRVTDYVASNPELKKKLENVRTKYNAYNQNLVNLLAETGAIPKELAAKLLRDGDYVSMYRVDKHGMAELLMGAHTINLGELRNHRELQALKGGDTKILPINDSMLRNTTLLMGKALSNQGAKSAAYAYQEVGAGKIQTGLGPTGPNVLHFSQEPAPGEKGEHAGKRWIELETKDTVLDGIPPELIAKALEGTNLVLPDFLRFAGAASNLLRTGVTRMPMYAVRQLIRDPMVSTGTAGLGGNPLTAVFRAGKEFISQTQGKSESAQKLVERGLAQSQIFTGDTHDLKKLALQLSDSSGNTNAIQHLFAVMDRASMRADSATRALVYENAKKNGLSEAAAIYATMQSMNFQKRGAWPAIQWAHHLIPFFSSQIQGLSVLAKAMRGNMPFNEQLQIKKKFFNNAILLFASGLAYAAAMEDDDYYKNAKPRDKMSNWFVHLPGVDEPIKIPIPFEYGFFFSAAVAAVEGMKEDTDNAQQFAAIRDMLLNAVPGYSNKGVPQIVKPIAELATNKDFYSWNPIETAAQEGLDPERRFNRNTSEMAKRLSSVLSVLSPIQIERLVNGYFGQAPLMIAGAVNSIFAEEGTAPRAEGHVTDTPFIGQAFQRKFGGEDADATYTLANKAVMAKKTLDDMAKEGNPAKAKEYQQSHMTELRGAALAEKFKAAMGELTKAEKAIRLQNIPPDAKQKRLDGIDETRQRVAEQYKKAFQRISAAA